MVMGIVLITLAVVGIMYGLTCILFIRKQSTR